jgi:hypothetical protein
MVEGGRMIGLESGWQAESGHRRVESGECTRRVPRAASRPQARNKHEHAISSDSHLLVRSLSSHRGSLYGGRDVTSRTSKSQNALELSHIYSLEVSRLIGGVYMEVVRSKI